MAEQVLLAHLPHYFTEVSAKSYASNPLKSGAIGVRQNTRHRDCPRDLHTLSGTARRGVHHGIQYVGEVSVGQLHKFVAAHKMLHADILHVVHPAGGQQFH